jgi:hypothetical protein
VTARRGRIAFGAAARVVVACAAGAAGCGGSDTVRLGWQDPPPYHFGTPQPLPELDPSYDGENPTLTADLLELYLTSDRGGKSTDVWTARRTSAADPFGAPEVISEVSTPSFETSSAVSLDGLTLWWGSERPGGLGALDIWVSTRAARGDAWGTPTDLVALNSTEKDVPRPPGLHGLVMPLASERDSPGLYQTFFSTRAGPDAPFGTPQPIPELTFTDKTVVDGFLTDDGLSLFYSSSASGGKGDLFVARRRSTSEPFSVIQPLTDLNTDADDRDPWLSPDGTLMFFSSDRAGGPLNIYQVAVTPPLSL